MSAPSMSQIAANLFSQEREDLHRLVDTLDAKEVGIVTQYVANLLLAGATAAAERNSPPPPPPNVKVLKGG